MINIDEEKQLYVNNNNIHTSIKVTWHEKSFPSYRPPT